MMADRNLINRRNVKEDPHAAYRADRDFLLLEVTARIICAAFHVLGMNNTKDKPQQLQIPETIKDQSKMEKRQFLHKAAAKIVDEIIVNEQMMDATISNLISEQEKQAAVEQMHLDENGRFLCRFPGCSKTFKHNGKSRTKHEQSHNPPVSVTYTNIHCSDADRTKPTTASPQTVDDIFNYNTALLSEGLFFLNFLDSVSEGDGERIMRNYKYLMLLCKADGSHSTKYALECLYQLLLVNGVMSEKDAEVFIWNRSVNNHGGMGMNIPLDLEVEHSNNYVKQGIRNLGANVTESAVTRISRAEKAVREVINRVDRGLHCAVSSGKHSERSQKSDLEIILKNLQERNIFENEERHYGHFPNFQRDPILSLDMSQMYKWIEDHKKKFASGIKAR